MLTKEVGAYEAKTHLSKLLDEVEAGTTVIITRYGHPVAELKSPALKNRRKSGCAKAKGPGFYMSPDFDEPLEEFKEYM